MALSASDEVAEYLRLLASFTVGLFESGGEVENFVIFHLGGCGDEAFAFGGHVASEDVFHVFNINPAARLVNTLIREKPHTL